MKRIYKNSIRSFLWRAWSFLKNYCSSVLLSPSYRHFLVLAGMSIINLLYMHYSISFAYVPELIDWVSIFDNLTGIIIDMTVVLLCCIIITNSKITTAFAMLYFVTFSWSFCNILYSRFFHSYISLSSISQGWSMTDSIVIKSTLQGFQWYDLIFCIWASLFIFYYKKTKNRYQHKLTKATIFIVSTFMLAIACTCDIGAHALFCLSKKEYRHFYYFKYRLSSHHILTEHALRHPIITNFHRGTIRMLAIEGYENLMGVKELTEQQEKSIQIAIQESLESMTGTIGGGKISRPNLIFIIVESYMAFTSDLFVDGKEITPNLNSLRHDSTTYFNGLMQPNITLGESADGQYIYMTGLLPLRSVITISKARKRVLPGLPKIMAEQGYYSQMIIPTQPTMWSQIEMCRQYGFNKLYSYNDYKDCKSSELSDEELFELAVSHLPSKKEKPFLSVLLTMSMHFPYDKPVDPTFCLNDPSLSSDMINYLNACHYTDRCIGHYLDYLKTAGLYDKSIIIIASDHHQNYVPLSPNITSDLPLYIIGGNIDNNTAWHNKCHQLDLYTTLLDVLGIKPQWVGLGHSLLSKDYKDPLTDNIKWDISEWILQGDYFAKTFN